MRKLFLEKLSTKDSFIIENRDWEYLWMNSLKYYMVSFYSMSKSRSTKIL